MMAPDFLCKSAKTDSIYIVTLQFSKSNAQCSVLHELSSGFAVSALTLSFFFDMIEP